MENNIGCSLKTEALSLNRSTGSVKMWKAAAGQSVSVEVNEGGDDWETDPDFEVPSSLILSYVYVPLFSSLCLLTFH